MCILRRSGDYAEPSFMYKWKGFNVVPKVVFSIPQT